MAIKRDFPDRPIVGVGAIVFKGASVLLIRRGKPPRTGQWSLPGGAQHLGETVRAAIEREVREETGVEIGALTFVDVVDSITPDESGGRVRYHYTLVDMAADWRAGALEPGSDAADCAWVPLDRLGDYGLWAETRRVIELAAAQRGRVPNA